MNMAEVLSGRAGLAGVQRALVGRAARKALRGVLAQLLREPAALGPCRLQRAKFKPGRKLQAYYNMRLLHATDGEHGRRPIAVTWTTPGAKTLPDATMVLEEIQAATLCGGAASSLRKLVADVPDWGMRLQVWPLDARFPQLVRLTDAQYVRDLLAVSYPCAVTPTRYRPGERHVLRYHPLAALGHTQARQAIFAKLYAHTEEGARTFHMATRAGDWLAASEDGVTAARPLAYVAEEAAVFYPGIAGTPLSHCLRRPGLKVMRHLQRAGSALRRLHAAPEALTSELKLHTFEAEVAVIARASEHIYALLPVAGRTLGDMLDRARAAHERLPPEPPTFTHGDFKAEHLWVAPAGLTLIDFDACALADPALDLGKFLADLRWWYEMYGWPDPEKAQARFMEGYGPNLPPARLARARLYEALLLVKIIARRLPLFEHDWALRTTQLIGRAEEALRDLRSFAGAPHWR